jgi:hypothetical protein
MNAYLVGEITSITLMLKVSRQMIRRSLMSDTTVQIILEKNMKELHIDGILESFDFESIDTCENFLEMIKTPFVGQKRTDD